MSALSKVFVSYRHVSPDQELAQRLVRGLEDRGHRVYWDQQIEVGQRWAEFIEARIRGSEAFVVLLSAESIRSDMIREEVKLAHQLAGEDGAGRLLVPVRVGFRDELPYDLGSYLNALQHVSWSRGESMNGVLRTVLSAVDRRASRSRGAGEDELPASPAAVIGLFEATEGRGAPLPATDPRLCGSLPYETGTLQLDSPFYVERPADRILRELMAEEGVTVAIRGPRQVGKSSLLARAHAACREGGHRIVYLNFQLIPDAHLASAETLFRYLARKLARELGTERGPMDYWDEFLGAQDSVTDFLEGEVLGRGPVSLFLDEVDRVFDFGDYSNAFFATLRAWHERRAVNSAWCSLGLFLAHSTDPNLWIENPYQSPFNVGLRLRLEDFTLGEVQELAGRHGERWRGEDTVHRIGQLVGGHPYLVRLCLYCLTSDRASLDELERAALDDHGPFGDHLRHFMWHLQRSERLTDVLRRILREGRCEDEDAFQRLRSAGLIRGTTREDVAVRCRLYETYLERHL